jgi:hypothetical protein
MDNEILEIALNRATTFEFELSITGISANAAKVRFGIEFPSHTLQFPCSRGDDSKWQVTVPKLEELGIEEGHYTFTIELIVDGYHFAPVKGTAKVTPVAEVKGTVPRKSVEVAVTSISTKTDEGESTKKKTKPKKEKVEEVVIRPESVVDKMIARRFKPFEKGRSILSQLTSDEEQVELTEKEKKVRDVLRGL